MGKSTSVTVQLEVLGGNAKLHETGGETTQNLILVDKCTRWRGIGITLGSNIIITGLGYFVLAPHLGAVLVMVAGLILSSIISVLLFLKLETGKTARQIISKWG